MNYDALVKLKEDLAKSSSYQDGQFVRQSAIDGEMEIRILPAKKDDGLNGSPFLTVTQYWVNETPFICPSTFGKPSPFAKFHEKMKREKNKVALEMIESGDSKVWKKEVQRWSRILKYTRVDFDENGKVLKALVEDKKIKVLTTGSTLTQAIVDILMGKGRLNGTKNGVCDLVKGRGITLKKTGKLLKTKYGAEAWPQPSAVPEKYLEEDVDLIALCKSLMKTNAEIEAFLRDFFESDDDDEDEKPTKKKIAPKSTKKRPADDDDEDDDDEDDDDEDEKPTKKKIAPKPTKKRPADDDDEDDDDEDDDDEDEKPTKKKIAPKSTKKRPADDDDEDDDDEDDDDEDEKPTKKKIAPKSTKKRPADDDDEDDDDEDDDDEDDDDEDEKPTKKKIAPKPTKKRPADDDDEDDDDEDEKPAKKKTGAAPLTAREKAIASAKAKTKGKGGKLDDYA